VYPAEQATRRQISKVCANRLQGHAKASCKVFDLDPILTGEHAKDFVLAVRCVHLLSF
jgi:hypothetical protein